MVFAMSTAIFGRAMRMFFDLDGTLVDSRERLHRLFCDLAQTDEIGVDQYWSLKRSAKTNEWILAKLLGLDSHAIATFVDRWMSLIETDPYLRLNTPFPYAKPVLQQLSRTAELFVLTSRQSESAVRSEIEQAGFLPYLTDVLVTRRACSKEQFLSTSGFKFGAIDFLVGDTGEDVRAARAIGAYSVAVLSGFRNREILEKYGPHAIYDDLNSFNRDFPNLTSGHVVERSKFLPT
jgi:phosphoglycolate phosphatase